MTDELSPVTIYTDGSCDPNPGPGGWAAILRFGAHEKKLTGAEEHTTNNRMELTAAIEALRALRRPCQVEFYTDSNYLKRGITTWLQDWKRRGWKRRDWKTGKEVDLANLDLWQALDAAIQPHQINWHWLPSHTGQPDNERVDRLAKQAIPRHRLM